MINLKYECSELSLIAAYRLHLLSLIEGIFDICSRRSFVLQLKVAFYIRKTIL